MTTWQNFNDADTQSSYDLIPGKTLAKVRMTLKPGGCRQSGPGLDRWLCHPQPGHRFRLPLGRIRHS